MTFYHSRLADEPTGAIVSELTCEYLKGGLKGLSCESVLGGQGLKIKRISH